MKMNCTKCKEKKFFKHDKPFDYVTFYYCDKYNLPLREAKPYCEFNRVKDLPLKEMIKKLN